MRLFVFIAALLFGAVPTPGIAQEQPYEARLIEVDDGPLVWAPVLRAPSYNVDTHVLVYIVSSFGMPEADLPFVFTPEGVVVSREEMSSFEASVQSEGGRMLFVCTVSESARATFDFAQKASRSAHCTLNEG